MSGKGSRQDPSHRGAPAHSDEARRLQALCSLGILDTPPSERFDRLTRLAARLFQVPISLVSLVESDRQWFKSSVGLAATETPREQSFCAHAILEDGVMVIPDATEDSRFRDNPLVTGEPDIRFYAGCPIRSADGLPLGTLCVIDHKPRHFDPADIRALRDLGELVELEIRALSISTIDELTGITNRRGLETIAPHVLGFCARIGRPATLMLFDLDGFKAINDQRGHAAGDRVLQAFANALVSTYRDCDIVARLGGDEFCVLLSGATDTDVMPRVADLAEHFARGVGPEPVGFSVGVHLCEATRDTDLAGLLHEADVKMYAHKASNRAGRQTASSS